jgi:iron complex outermembrane recepter protein
MRVGEVRWAAAAFGALLTVAGTLPAPARAAPEQTLDEVVVTGSRLTRSTEEATGPVTVLDKADLERGTPDSLGEILLSLPLQNGATQTLNDNDNDGATRVNLRPGS